MIRRYVIPLFLLLLLGGAFGWWWYQPERVLARRVAGLFDAANVATDDGNITRSTRGNAIEPYLAPNLSFEGPDGATDEIDGPQSRSSVVSLFSYLAKACRRISIKPPEIDRMAITGEEAVVEARIDAVIELANERSPVDGIQHLTMTWRKVDGKWVLATTRWRETGR
jgi:hypothetical protein